jgi:hypothetical protein
MLVRMFRYRLSLMRVQNGSTRSISAPKRRTPAPEMIEGPMISMLSGPRHRGNTRDETAAFVSRGLLGLPLPSALINDVKTPVREDRRR